MNQSHEPTPAPLWTPDPVTIEATHIAAAMKVRGLESYDELYQWSIAQPGQFWAWVLETLNIPFARQPDQVLDLSRGPAFPRWLSGARLNIAESCFCGPPDACALVEQTPDGTRRSFSGRTLRKLANRIAHGLTTHGVGPGDSVAVFMPMTAESVAIYLGIVLAGCTVVSVADSFSADQLASRLQIARAKALFTVDAVVRSGKRVSVYDRVRNANAPMAIVLAKAAADDREDSPEISSLRDGDLSWTNFLSDDESDTVVYGAPDTPMNVLFSSGTTGDPKAIVWDHSTPIKAAADGYFHHDIHAGDVVAWPTNLGWMMGPWLIFATLINRGTIALFDGVPTDPLFADFVRNAGVNMLGVVPSLVRRWRESGRFDDVTWPDIKAFSSTGECSSPDDMRWLSERAGGRPIIEYCGGTEIGGGYITSTLVQPNIPSAFSSPAMGSAVVVLDDDGRPADEGELYLVPPALGLSQKLLNRDNHEVYYANTPADANGRVLRRHGDRMRRLSNGYYRAAGRTDDTMNLGGIKVGTAEVERALSNLTGLREVAAVAVPPAEGGPDRLMIFCAMEDNNVRTNEQLKTDCQQLISSGLNPLFRIHQVVTMDALPRTASNKIMRRLLREQIAAS